MITPRGGMPSPIRPGQEGPELPIESPIQAPGRMGMRQPMPRSPYYGMMKKGGKVKKTGLYKLHRGEHVIPLSSLVKA